MTQFQSQSNPATDPSKASPMRAGPPLTDAEKAAEKAKAMADKTQSGGCSTKSDSYGAKSDNCSTKS